VPCTVDTCNLFNALTTYPLEITVITAADPDKDMAWRSDDMKNLFRQRVGGNARGMTFGEDVVCLDGERSVEGPED